MNQAAVEARREYARKYRKENRARMNEMHKKWRDKPENKEKIKLYNERFWEKKAAEMT
jgi:hypothetical protein